MFSSPSFSDLSIVRWPTRRRISGAAGKGRFLQGAAGGWLAEGDVGFQGAAVGFQGADDGLPAGVADGSADVDDGSVVDEGAGSAEGADEVGASAE